MLLLLLLRLLLLLSHLSYWSLVMNCSRLHCMMQETQSASQTSHMNLTGSAGSLETRQTTSTRTSHTFMLFLSLSLPTTDIKIIKSVQPQPDVQEEEEGRGRE